MKKKVILLLILFLMLIFAIKASDISLKYGMNIFDYAKYSMSLTNQEKNYLRKKDISYGINIKDPPFSYISLDTGQNTGILVDYFNQLSVTLEKEFTGVTYDDYDLAVSLISRDINAAILNKTVYNQQVFLFTEPLYTLHCKVLVKNESPFEKLEDVENTTIAVVTGSLTHHYANKFFKDNDNVKLILTKDLNECLYLLGMGEVDAIAGDEAKISYQLNQAIKDKKFRFLNNSIYSEDISVAVNKDDAILFSILNKGILELKENNQYMHIHSKWFGSFMPEVRDISDYNDFSNIIILIIAIVFVLGSWNHVISLRVNERTKELNYSRKELRDVIDSLRDGLMVYDEDGVILECNNSMTKILNLSRDNIINKRFDELEEIKPYLEHVNDKESFQIMKSYYLVMLRRLETLSDMNLFIIEDYTERHKYELISRQDAKMMAVGELSAGLAHEIRNPLGLIKNYLFVLGKKYQDDLSLHAISVIDDSVKRINNLISNLLNFSRLSKEGDKEVNVDVLLNSIITLENKNLRDNDVKLSVIKSDDMPDKFLLNEDVFKLGIINLINNSIDSFDGTDIIERNIKIYLKISNEKLIIKVQDNGKGIQSSDLEKIFNPFYTTKDTGTGLGIYILASELRAIEGSITCESEQYVGTIFHITLPIKGV